jgi:hypothetical protein
VLTLKAVISAILQALSVNAVKPAAVPRIEAPKVNRIQFSKSGGPKEMGYTA